MTRSDRNRRKRATSQYRGGVATPPPIPPSRRASRSSLDPPRRFLPLTLSTRPTARSSVLKTPAVRPLIRTARTDTTIALQHGRRRPMWHPPNRRPSPDLPNRVLTRLKSWNTFVNNPLKAVYQATPLHRTLTCARRSIRREVLLALGLGNGSGSRGVPKSTVRCTR